MTCALTWITAALLVALPTRADTGDELALSDVRMVAPAFRGTIQSQDPEKLLWLQGTAPVGLLGASTLRLEVEDLEGRVLLRRTWRVQAGSTFDLRVPVGSLPPQEYCARLQLVSGSSLPPQREFAFRVLPPAATEVTFDHRRVCYVNGRPFFPLGLYHVAPGPLAQINARAEEAGLPTVPLRGALTDVRLHGFNCVHHSWGMASDEYLALAREQELMVLPEIGCPGRDDLRSYVARAANHSNVLLWYTVDEAHSPELEAQARSIYAAALEEDPHRPVAAAVGLLGAASGAVEFMDLLMPDYYTLRVQRDQSLADFAGWIQATGEIAERAGRPMWVVPQAFGGADFWRTPTPRELRCQAYIALTCGATGLIWYSYWDGVATNSGEASRFGHWFLPERERLWWSLGSLNRELQDLIPFVLEGEVQPEVTCSSPAVYARAWRSGGRTLLMAVNSAEEPIECTFANLGPRSGEARSFGRRGWIVDGCLSDRLLPLDVRAYVFE